MLERTYRACLSMADWCEQRTVLTSCLAGSAVFLITVAIGTLVLDRFPNSGDEYAYLYQADTMAAGRLSNPAPAEPDAFRFNYIVRRGDRVYGTFPPGWPVALALAARLHVPYWAVNPLCGALSLVLLWALGRELYGPRSGPLAAALLVSSGFFLFNAASFFSHTFCGLLLLAAAYSAVVAHDRSTVAPLLTGFLIGWGVVTRYFTGAVLRSGRGNPPGCPDPASSSACAGTDGDRRRAVDGVLAVVQLRPHRRRLGVSRRWT